MVKEQQHSTLIGVGTLLVAGTAVAIAWAVLELPTTSYMVLPVAGVLSATVLAASLIYVLGARVKVGVPMKELITVPVVVSETNTQDGVPVTTEMRVFLIAARLGPHYTDVLAAHAKAALQDTIGRLSVHELQKGAEGLAWVKEETKRRIEQALERSNWIGAGELHPSETPHLVMLELDGFQIPAEARLFDKELAQRKVWVTEKLSTAEARSDWLLRATTEAQEQLGPDAFQRYMDLLRLLIPSDEPPAGETTRNTEDH